MSFAGRAVHPALASMALLVLRPAAAEYGVKSRMIAYRRLRQSVGLLLCSCVVGAFGLPAWSQTRTEAELERQSKELVLKVVEPLTYGLRWAPGRFPLPVSVVSGVELQQIGCAALWNEELNEYLSVVNKKEKLLAPVLPNAANLAAFAYFGTVHGLEQSENFRAQQAFADKPGIVRQFLVQSHVDQSYLVAYGTGNFIEFAANFQELNAQGIPRNQRCTSLHLAEYLGWAVLQGYAMTIRGRAVSMFGENYDVTIAWRAHRRLLAAMRKLSPADLDWQQVKPALIETLLKD
jgi:hypothetical protein